MQIIKKNLENIDYHFLLLLILIFGGFIRFYGLEIQSFWTDEIASWVFSRIDNLSKLIKEIIEKDAFPPAYYVFLHFIIKFFGDSEFVLRLPSAICGTIAIVAIFALGKRLYSVKEGLISAAFMSVMWCPIYYSQEARQYIFLILFSMLSVFYWLPIIRNFEINRMPLKTDIFYYILWSILCCYTHYFGGYLIALQGLGTVIFFFRKKAARKYIFLIYLLIGLAFIFWLPVFFFQIERSIPAAAVSDKPVTLFRFIKFWGYIFGAQKSPFIILETYSKIDILISVLIIFATLALISTLFLIKFYDYFNKNKIKKKKIYYQDSDIILFLWLIIPYFGIYILAKLSFSIFNYRYLLISLPAAYLLVSRSITKLFKKKKLQILMTISLVVLFAIHLIYYKNYFSKPDKEQYREAVYYVIENDKFYKDSKIIGYTFDHFFDYYLQRARFSKKIDLYVNWRKDMVSVLDKINFIQTQYIWLISAKLIPNEKFFQHISKRYKLIRNVKLVEANVWLFEKI